MYLPLAISSVSSSYHQSNEKCKEIFRENEELKRALLMSEEAFQNLKTKLKSVEKEKMCQETHIRDLRNQVISALY